MEPKTINPMDYQLGCIELARDMSWVATRFALKERGYKDAPPIKWTRRWKLETLSPDNIRRLAEFCDEQKIEAKFLTEQEAKQRPADW